MYVPKLQNSLTCSFLMNTTQFTHALNTPVQKAGV